MAKRKQKRGRPCIADRREVRISKTVSMSATSWDKFDKLRKPLGRGAFIRWTLGI